MSGSITDEQREEYQVAFTIFDEDGSGGICYSLTWLVSLLDKLIIPTMLCNLSCLKLMSFSDLCIIHSILLDFYNSFLKVT